MEKRVIKSIIVIFLLLLIVGLVYALNQQTIVSNDWHDFYGYIKDAKIGDVVTAKDPNGVVSGSYKIDILGKYGFMHVYADDPLTTLDEGAKVNDIITFYLNDRQMKGNVSWKGGRERTMLNLSIVAGDSDGDRVSDEQDLCPKTPKGALVDKNGCSAKQFCELIKISSKTDYPKCQLADWKSNEPGIKPNDCQIKTILFLKYCTNTKNAN